MKSTLVRDLISELGMLSDPVLLPTPRDKRIVSISSELVEQSCILKGAKKTAKSSAEAWWERAVRRWRISRISRGFPVFLGQFCLWFYIASVEIFIKTEKVTSALEIPVPIFFYAKYLVSLVGSVALIVSKSKIHPWLDLRSVLINSLIEYIVKRWRLVS